MKRAVSKKAKAGFTKADLKAVSNNPEWTEADFAKAKPFSEVFPVLHDSIKRSRGRPKLDNAKEAVTLRLPPDCVEKFKSTGRDWRTKMVKALEKAKV